MSVNGIPSPRATSFNWRVLWLSADSTTTTTMTRFFILKIQNYYSKSRALFLVWIDSRFGRLHSFWRTTRVLRCSTTNGQPGHPLFNGVVAALIDRPVGKSAVETIRRRRWRCWDVNEDGPKSVSDSSCYIVNKRGRNKPIELLYSDRGIRFQSISKRRTDSIFHQCHTPMSPARSYSG